MTLRELASKGSKVWFQWASFKLGVFVGVIIGFVVMALMLTVPRIAFSILGGIQ